MFTGLHAGERAFPAPPIHRSESKPASQQVVFVVSLLQARQEADKWRKAAGLRSLIYGHS